MEEVLWAPSERTVANLWMGFTSPSHNPYQTGGLQHLLARHIRENVGSQVFNSYFKFAFVRNPWDRAVSQFSFMASRPDLRSFVGLPQGASFATYLDAIEHKVHVQWEQQLAFINDRDGSGMIDFIGRFENLSRMPKLCLTILVSDALSYHTLTSLSGMTIDLFMTARRSD